MLLLLLLLLLLILLRFGAWLAGVVKHIHESVMFHWGLCVPLVLLVLFSDVDVVQAGVTDLFVLWVIPLLPLPLLIFLLLLLMLLHLLPYFLW